jgi:hypothetical protein
LLIITLKEIFLPGFLAAWALTGPPYIKTGEIDYKIVSVVYLSGNSSLLAHIKPGYDSTQKYMH